jgi:tetratricopeptide (TPR) repeat protein
MHYNFNVFERKAREYFEAGDYDKALRLYFFMADGDPSLDGGYLGAKIAECYEKKGEFYAAKYWHGRAVEENPEVRTASAAARERLEKLVTIDDIIEDYDWATNKTIIIP